MHHLYDPDDGLIEFHTDTSKTALSAIFYLSVQGKLKPVSYRSRKFETAEVSYNTAECKLLAIVDSCRHWRHYLYA